MLLLRSGELVFVCMTSSPHVTRPYGGHAVCPFHALSKTIKDFADVYLCSDKAFACCFRSRLNQPR